MGNKLILCLVSVLVIATLIITLLIFKKEPLMPRVPTSYKTTDTIAKSVPADRTEVTTETAVPVITKKDEKQSITTTSTTVRSSTPPADSTKEMSREEKVKQLIEDWKSAIINEDNQNVPLRAQDLVDMIDDTFEKLKGLVEDKNENERVRSFSLRVLGSLRRVELVEFYAGLLRNDKSQYVRENAAWALGELAGVLNKNTEMRQKAIDSLNLAVQLDTSEMVRRIAKESVERIQKGEE